MLDKRVEKKREKGEEFQLKEHPKKRVIEESENSSRKKNKVSDEQLDTVLGSIF